MDKAREKACGCLVSSGCPIHGKEKLTAQAEVIERAEEALEQSNIKLDEYRVKVGVGSAIDYVITNRRVISAIRALKKKYGE